MSLLEYISYLSIVYLPWQLLCLVVRVLNLRYLQIYFIFFKSVESECNKIFRALITNDLHQGSEPTLGRSLMSIHLRHMAVSNAKIYGDGNGDN
jgi:hypothetical protein